MMLTFLHGRLNTQSVRERRLIYGAEEFTNVKTYVPVEGEQARKDELNPHGINRKDPNINGLDEMIQKNQEMYRERAKNGETVRKTQLFEIQTALQSDCAKNTNPELAAQNGLPVISKRQWVDMTNAKLEEQSANYRVSMINDTVVPKPAPTITPIVNEGAPAAPTLASNAGVQRNMIGRRGPDGLFAVQDTIPASNQSIVENANAMIGGREVVNMTEKERNKLMGEIMMKTGASVEVKDNKFVVTPPASNFERTMNSLGGAFQFIDAVFAKENGERIKLNPSQTEDQRREKMNKIVDKNDPAEDRTYEEKLKKDITDTTASIEKSEQETARLRALPDGDPEKANLGMEEKVLVGKRQYLADLQADVQTFQALLKERATRPDWVKKLPSAAQQAFVQRNVWKFTDNDQAKERYFMDDKNVLTRRMPDGTATFYDATPGKEGWKTNDVTPAKNALPDWVQKLPADAQFAFKNRNQWKYVNDNPKNVGYMMDDKGVLTQRYSNGREDFYDATPGVEKWKLSKLATPEMKLTPENIQSIGLDNILSMQVVPEAQSDGTYILDLPDTVWDFEFKFNGKSWEWRVEDGTWNSANTNVGDVAEANWDPAAKNQAVNFQVALRQANQGYSIRRK